MNYEDARLNIALPMFSRHQLGLVFPEEPNTLINTQLARWVEKKKLTRLRRGLFLFPHAKIDEMVLANYIYRPSYVSLESALNYYGIIPDVPGNVTSVSPVTSKIVRTARGAFFYSKIAKHLYFGWKPVKDNNSEFRFSIAEPEKAVLDYVYIRRIRDIIGQRIDLAQIDRKKLMRHGRMFPDWVMETINEQHHQ